MADLQLQFASRQQSRHMAGVVLLPVAQWQQCSMFLRQSSRWRQQCHTDGLYLRDKALKGDASSTSSYQNQVSGMPIQFLAYLWLKPVYKRATVSCCELQHWQKKIRAFKKYTNSRHLKQTNKTKDAFVCLLLLRPPALLQPPAVQRTAHQDWSDWPDWSDWDRHWHPKGEST